MYCLITHRFTLVLNCSVWYIKGVVVFKNEKDCRREHIWRSHWSVELSSKQCCPGFSTTSTECAAPHVPQAPDLSSESELVTGRSSEALNQCQETALKAVLCVEAFDVFKIAMFTGQIFGTLFL